MRIDSVYVLSLINGFARWPDERHALEIKLFGAAAACYT